MATLSDRIVGKAFSQFMEEGWPPEVVLNILRGKPLEQAILLYASSKKMVWGE
jgi:hypothetical protein